MIKYTVKRILMIIPIVLGVTFILFVLLYSLPGSMLRFMPINSNGDALDSLFRFFNPGDNIITKYIRYCYNVFIRFELSITGSAARMLSRDLGYRIRNTLLLLFSGALVTVIAGIPIGVYTAVRKDRITDRIFNTISLFLSAIPNYAMATMLTLTFVVYIRVIPLFSIDYRSPVAFILPSLTIFLGGVASISRMTRTSVLETLDRPFITALRAKGLRDSEVIWKHAIKNAVVPTAAVLGGLISSLLCGTLVVEYFFNVPGLGSFMLKAVGSRDHFAILGCTIIMTIILSATNTLSDILYAFVNPQIRREYAGVKRNPVRKGIVE